MVWRSIKSAFIYPSRFRRKSSGVCGYGLNSLCPQGMGEDIPGLLVCIAAAFCIRVASSYFSTFQNWKPAWQNDTSAACIYEISLSWIS